MSSASMSLPPSSSSSAEFLLPKSQDAFPLAVTSSTKESFVTISELRPGRTNFAVEVIILESHERKPYIRKARRATNRKVDNDEVILYVYHVADRSGSIVLNIFQNSGEYLEPGDIIRITGAYCRIYDETESLQLYAGPKAGIKRVGEDVLEFRVMPNWSHFLWETDPNDPQALRSIPPPETDIPLHWFPKKNRQVFGHKVKPGDLRPREPVPAQPAVSPTPGLFAGQSASSSTPIVRPIPSRDMPSSFESGFPESRPPEPTTARPTDPRLRAKPSMPPKETVSAPAALPSGVNDIQNVVDQLTPYYPSRQHVLDLLTAKAKEQPGMTALDVLGYLRKLLSEKRAESLSRGPTTYNEVGMGRDGRQLSGGNTRSIETYDHRDRERDWDRDRDRERERERDRYYDYGRDDMRGRGGYPPSSSSASYGTSASSGSYGPSSSGSYGSTSSGSYGSGGYGPGGNYAAANAPPNYGRRPPTPPSQTQTWPQGGRGPPGGYDRRDDWDDYDRRDDRERERGYDYGGRGGGGRGRGGYGPNKRPRQD